MIFLDAKFCHCYALGCLRGTKPADLMCVLHEPKIPKKLAKVMAEHFDAGEFKNRRVQNQFAAAAYRARTAIAVAEGKIKKDVAERMEFYCKTKIERKAA